MEISLNGIKGNNMLGYFAGLGVVKSLSQRFSNVCLKWNDSNTASLRLDEDLGPDELVEILFKLLRESAKAFGKVGKDKFHKTTKSRFRGMLKKDFSDLKSVEILRFLSGDTQFLPETANERVTLSSLVLLQGTGNKDYLKTVANLNCQMTQCQLKKTLFEEWGFSEESRNVSLLFSAFDRQDAALLAAKPTGINPAQLAANRLAADGLLYFPTFYATKDKQWTTGMDGEVFRWCLNSEFLDENAIKVLVKMTSSPELLNGWPCYQAKRVTAGYYFFFDSAHRT